MSVVTKGLTVGYLKGRPVLDQISLTVERGQILGVLGRNGSGKSTLVQCLAGELVHERGQVLVDGQDVSGTRSRGRVRHGVVTVPENRQIFGTLTVRENLSVAAFGAGVPLDNETIRRLAADFDVLETRSGDLAAGLSGGQQQMLAIARALVARPKYLLVDEPSLGLAPRMIDAVGRVLRSVAADGVGVLLAEQNAGLVLGLCDEVLLLGHADGPRRVEVGDPSVQEFLRESYLEE